MKLGLWITLLFASSALYAQKNSSVIQRADSLFQTKNWQAAIDAYLVGLKTSPDNSMAWNRLGFSYHNLKQYDQALNSYNNALLYKPSVNLEVIVQSRLARIYTMMKHFTNAVKSLDRALVLGYSNLTELENEPEFENLRATENYIAIYNRASVNAFPCMGLSQAREFDFWIGEWNAYITGTENLAGHSKIEMASGGCMILENWTSMGQPFTGKSMNFIDPVTKKWKQVWVGSAGINATEFLNGEYREGAMRFDFETIDAVGKKQWVQFHFYNEDPNQVRQVHKTSPDGFVWTTTYDFTYKRLK